jgi:hypothetical protein
MPRFRRYMLFSSLGSKRVGWVSSFVIKEDLFPKQTYICIGTHPPCRLRDWRWSIYLRNIGNTGHIHMMKLNNNWMVNSQGKPKYSEKTWPSATLSTTNPTCCPDANPARRGGKPATNRLSNGTTLLYLAYSLTLKREAICSSETLSSNGLHSVISQSMGLFIILLLLGRGDTDQWFSKVRSLSNSPYLVAAVSTSPSLSLSLPLQYRPHEEPNHTLLPVECGNQHAGAIQHFNMWAQVLLASPMEFDIPYLLRYCLLWCHCLRH